MVSPVPQDKEGERLLHWTTPTLLYFRDCEDCQDNRGNCRQASVDTLPLWFPGSDCEDYYGKISLLCWTNPRPQIPAEYDISTMHCHDYMYCNCPSHYHDHVKIMITIEPIQARQCFLFFNTIVWDPDCVNNREEQRSNWCKWFRRAKARQSVVEQGRAKYAYGNAKNREEQRRVMWTAKHCTTHQGSAKCKLCLFEWKERKSRNMWV